MAVELVSGFGSVQATDLVSLSTEVYGAHPDLGDPRWFSWLYEGAPEGPGVCVSAVEDGRITGHYGVVPVMLQVGRERVRAGLGVNALVSPRSQGRGLFAKMVHRAHQLAGDVGLGVTYAVAGPESAPWFSSILRYKAVGTLSLLVRPEDLRRLASAVGSPGRGVRFAAAVAGSLLRAAYALLPEPRVPAGVELRATRHWGDEHERLWNTVGRNLSHTAARTRSFLQWRYADAPTRRYQAIDAYLHGDLLGYIVYRRRGTHHAASLVFGSIVDLVVGTDGTSLGTGAALAGAAIRDLRGQGVDAVTVQLARPSPLYRAFARNSMLPTAGVRQTLRPIFFRGTGDQPVTGLHHMGGDYDMG